MNHYRPEGLPIPGTDRPASGFQTFYGVLLRGFPDAAVEINEQLAERDLVATRKTFRGTHLGEIWDLPPSENLSRRPACAPASGALARIAQLPGTAGANLSWVCVI